MDISNIGSLSMKGGRNDNFYFCLIEYYPDSKRWFLKSLLSVKDEEALDNDDAIHAWINNFNVKQLVVDFPLSKPASESSSPEESIKVVRQKIRDLLNEDQKLISTNPKKYEQERNKADEIVYNRDVFLKETAHHLLSRSFKRRLKKGFLPYWNRALDFWVWKYYYDQILELFNTSFDSFGNVYLTLEDRQRMAKVLKISASQFTRKYCEKVGGIYRLKEQKADKSCTFLEEKKCQIYEGRPTQCRTWPFWPEVMGAKLWKKEVADFCPGAIPPMPPIWIPIEEILANPQSA